MNKKNLKKIIKLVKKSKHINLTNEYCRIESSFIFRRKLVDGCHTHVNGYPNYGIYVVQQNHFKDLCLVFTEYPTNGPRMHIFETTNHNVNQRQIENSLGEFHDDATKNNYLYLKYKPSKRDGRNEERKKKFIYCYGRLEVYLPVDDNFIEKLFDYAKCRHHAHYLD